MSTEDFQCGDIVETDNGVVGRVIVQPADVVFLTALAYRFSTGGLRALTRSFKISRPHYRLKKFANPELLELILELN